MTGVTALYESEVRHQRLTPVRYAFAQRTYYWLVDVDALPRLPFYARPLAVFSARDHFGDPASTIRQNVDRYLAARGVDLRGGHVLMLCQARVLGHVLNPLTLFWCRYDDGSPACVVAEVHNTYGGRHCYLLMPDTDDRTAFSKEFHVSPFFPVEGEYRMRVPAPGANLRVSVDYRVAGTTHFVALLSGVRHPVTRRTLLRIVIRRPAATLAVSTVIRMHGLRLLKRGVPWHPCPARDRGRRGPIASRRSR